MTTQAGNHLQPTLNRVAQVGTRHFFHRWLRRLEGYLRHATTGILDDSTLGGTSEFGKNHPASSSGKCHVTFGLLALRMGKKSKRAKRQYID